MSNHAIRGPALMSEFLSGHSIRAALRRQSEVVSCGLHDRAQRS
jgi:hypothetical protein